MEFKELKKLAPHVAKETWEKFLLVLEFFVLQHPQPSTHRPFWALCVETLLPASPQAFIVIDRSGRVLRFHWSRPQDRAHQYSYWEDWYQKALELREGFNALEAQRQEEHEAPLLAQREAERFARDLASREQEQGYGYDLAVTVTVKVERLPRRNAAQPKGPKWAWVCVEVAFERGERSVSLDHLFGIQEIYLRLNVESERHRRDLFRAFEAWIVKQVAAGRLRWSATEDDSVELP